MIRATSCRVLGGSIPTGARKPRVLFYGGVSPGHSLVNHFQPVPRGERLLEVLRRQQHRCLENRLDRLVGCPADFCVMFRSRCSVRSQAVVQGQIGRLLKRCLTRRRFPFVNAYARIWFLCRYGRRPRARPPAHGSLKPLFGIHAIARQLPSAGLNKDQIDAVADTVLQAAGDGHHVALETLRA